MGDDPAQARKSDSNGLKTGTEQATSGSAENMADNQQSVGLRTHEVDIHRLQTDEQGTYYVPQENIVVSELPLQVSLSPEQWTRGDNDASQYESEFSVQQFFDELLLPRTSTPYKGRNSTPMQMNLSQLNTPAKVTENSMPRVEDTCASKQQLNFDQGDTCTPSNSQDHSYSALDVSTTTDNAKQPCTSVHASDWSDDYQWDGLHERRNSNHLNKESGQVNSNNTSISRKGNSHSRKAVDGNGAKRATVTPDTLNESNEWQSRGLRGDQFNSWQSNSWTGQLTQPKVPSSRKNNSYHRATAPDKNTTRAASFASALDWANDWHYQDVRDRPKSRQSSNWSGNAEATKTSTTTRGNMNVKSTKVHPVKKDWLDDPVDLDPETCDLIYLVPEHLRSEVPDDVGGNRLVPNDDGNESIERARAVCTTMEQLLNKHLSMISSIADPTVQRKEHQKFISNPLVKLHYEEVAALLVRVKPTTEAARALNETMQSNDNLTTGPSGPETPRSTRKRNAIPDGIYTISLKSKNLLPIDTSAVFNDAVKHCGIHVDVTKKEGMSIVVHLRSAEERDTVMKALNEYKYLAEKLTHYYEITDDAKSPFIIRTNIIGKRTLATLKFIKEGKLIREEAMDAIMSRNRRWFRKSDDIVGIQLRESTNPAGKYLQVLMTEEAHERVQEGLKKSMRLDLVYAQLEVYVPLSVTNCFRCCDPGHDVSSCKGPLRCRFCITGHTNKRSCPAKEGKIPITCFRCSEHNSGLAPGDWHLEKSVTHHATHKECPFYSTLRKQVLRELSDSQSSAKRPRLN